MNEIEKQNFKSPA